MPVLLYACPRVCRQEQLSGQQEWEGQEHPGRVTSLGSTLHPGPSTLSGEYWKIRGVKKRPNQAKMPIMIANTQISTEKNH